MSDDPLREQRINEAYEAALDGRDPDDVIVFELLPTIYQLVPDATPEEILLAIHRCEDA